MSSSDNEVSKWHPEDVREIAELLSPLVSPNNVHILSPETPLPGIDQYMHISGKTDSAYSSFSGSSNLPDVPMSLGSGEHDLLPLKQMPYMDSGYIGNICNPSARHSEDGQMYENKIGRKGNYPRLDSPTCIKSYGSQPTPEMLYQTASPLIRLSPLLSHPPSPTGQVDHYKINRNVDETHAGICFSRNVQGETYMEEGNQGLPLHTLPNCCNDCWLSFSQNESPVTEKDAIWCPTNLNTTKNSTTSSTKHSVLQEKSKLGSLAKKLLTAQNAIYAYKIPEATRAKPSLSLQTNRKPVNDPLEDKQYYASSVHKPHFGEADLTSRAPVPRKQEGQLYGLLDLFRVDDYSGFDHSIYKSSKSLKYADSSVPNEVTPRIINTYEDKDSTFCSEEGNNRSISQQPLKIQNLPSQSLAPTETSYGKIYETSRSGSYFNYDAEEVASQLFSSPGKAEQNTTSSTSLLAFPKQEEMLKPFGFPRLPFSKAESQPQNDSANIKINRKTTPLLYYLSGGRNSSLMNHKNLDQEHEDFLMKSPRNNHSGLAEPGIRPKDSNSHADDIVNKNEGSLDEKFKNDYREKLKFAQQKVLRETSFKRKDLQMSLPVRLKEKPSSRPSIEHLRSFSLSSTNEDSKSIPPTKPQENTYADWESKKPQTLRIGARKRATKEQKKMSYSEPDKLNQLDDQKDQNISWGQKKARSRSDEITGQGIRIIRSKALENQGRAISKAELKQLQQNALLEYMERKIGQQPAVAKNWSQQTSQLRILSSKRLPEDNSSNPDIIRKSQNMSFPFPASGRIHEPPSSFPTLTCTTTTTDRCIVRSLESDLLNSKAQPAISEESYNSKYVPAQSFLHSDSVSSRVRERSQSVPSPVQDYYRSTAFSTSSSQDHEYYAAHHSFSVSKKEDSADSEEDKKSLENSHSKEVELSSFSKENSKNSQLKQQISENLEVFSDPGGTQWQHREEEDASDQSEERTDNCTTLLDNEGPQHLSQQFANLKVPQNEQEHQFSLQDTALSIAQSKSQQDQKYGHLAVEVIAEDSSLVDILMPHPSRKTVYDLMEGLFPVNSSVVGRTHRRNGGNQSAQANDQRSNECGTDPYHGTANEFGYRAEDEMFHINEMNENKENKESLPDVDRITSKKKQLILSIQSKLQSLQDEKELIQSEALEHAAHGKVLDSLVRDLCKPNEFERYLMFMGDLEKVVNLLLCLSTRLARIHNAMGKMDENTDAEEKESLNERYRLLSRQREDAKDLKENLDRRERVVSGILSKYMSENQLQDYKHFIQEKITLLIEQKDLEEHVKFLEEQLERLEKSILP
ncbi:protein Shroom1 [Ahaetulla prasina]|uniref:protein Shroom1 n=1 Tax=Ahaetulla prasina TaxID=499056 RepID=UPI00264818C8|nr:protein Shroom1 [Ahaetulla prasina]XP_058022660.1 protein Shroom1 [Ahaetulla prasina]XP_058022661.1 protein Shroom1 [Ahaetulla prasina]